MKTESGLCGSCFTVCSRRRWRRDGRGPRSRDPQKRGGRGPVGARAPEKQSPAKKYVNPDSLFPSKLQKVRNCSESFQMLSSPR